MSLDSFYTPEKISKPEIFRGYTKRPVKWYGLILKTGNFKNFENYALVWHFKLIKAKKNQRLLFSRIEVCLGLSDVYELFLELFFGNSSFVIAFHYFYEKLYCRLNKFLM